MDDLIEIGDDDEPSVDALHSIEGSSTDNQGQNRSLSFEEELLGGPLDVSVDLPYSPLIGASAAKLILCGTVVSAPFLQFYLVSMILTSKDEPTVAALSVARTILFSILTLTAAPLSSLSTCLGHDLKTMGRGGPDNVSRLFQAALLLSLPCVSICVLLCFLIRPFLSSEDPAIVDPVQTFFWIFLPSIPALYLRLTYSHFLNGLNKQIFPLCIDFLMSFITPIVTYLLNNLHPPLTSFGIAILINTWTSALIYHFYLLFHENFQQYQLFKPRGDYLPYVTRLFQQGFFMPFIFVGEVSIILLILGLLPLGNLVSVVTQNILTLYFILLTLAPQAAFFSTSTLVSYAYGAKNFHNVERFVIAGGGLGTLFPLLLTILFGATPSTFSDPFLLPSLNTTDLAFNTSHTLPIIGAIEIVDSVRMAICGALLGLQDAAAPAAISIVFQLVIGVPVMYSLARYTTLGVGGISAGYAVSLVLVTVVLGHRLVQTFFRLKIGNYVNQKS